MFILLMRKYTLSQNIQLPIYKVGAGGFHSTQDLVALALIPKLAAHFTHLKCLVIPFGKKREGAPKKKKEREMASAGECLFA